MDRIISQNWHRHPWLVAMSWGCLLLLAACEPQQSTQETGPKSAPETTLVPLLSPETLPQPIIPLEGGIFSPSLTQVSGALPSTSGPGQGIAEKEDCAGCHPMAAHQWSGSAHSLSSFNNPLYRFAFDKFVAARGPAQAPFCGSCHDPALLINGGLADVNPHDEKASQSIGCGLCHGVIAASDEGNGSYIWDSSPIPIPKKNRAKTLRDHRARVGLAKSLGDTLCQSCHRGFVGPHTGHEALLMGLDEVGPHRNSPYGGSAATRVDPNPPTEQGCISCHMPEGAAHRFPGGHTTLAAMQNNDAQLQALQTQLKDTAEIFIVPLAQTEGSFGATLNLEIGQPLAFDVVIFNKGVAHRFPGGARDLRDTWLEIEVKGPKGKTILQSGLTHEAGGRDGKTHRLGALVSEEAGIGILTHGVGDFRTAVFDHTILPRDSIAVRFIPEAETTLPKGPLEITARLKHRRLTDVFYQANCEASKTPRGKAFLKSAKSYTQADMDPCTPQPILTLVETSTFWKPGAVTLGQESGDLVLYHHAQALAHQLQERLGEAIQSIDLAQSQLTATTPSLHRASLLALKAQIAGDQGRTEEALELLKQAEALVPNHAAIHTLRGQALSKVWRWDEAQAAYALATQGAPKHDALWRGLAMAAGSAGDRRGALEAAQNGLKLEPRDPDLLRSQYLAYQHLAPGSPAEAQAKAAYLRYRPDDLAPAIKARCSDLSPDCLRERLPVHVHVLMPTSDKAKTKPKKQPRKRGLLPKKKGKPRKK